MFLICALLLSIYLIILRFDLTDLLLIYVYFFENNFNQKIMADFFKIIYNEISGGTDTSLLIWILFGFIVIVLISRRVSKFKELGNRNRLLFLADLILFPIIIILFHLISIAIDKTNALSLSFSLFLITSAWFFNRALGLYFWNKHFVLDCYLTYILIIPPLYYWHEK